MAETSGSAPGTPLNFVDQVSRIIPNITPPLLRKLFDYLKSAGVCSEADIGKVDERQLAAIVGQDDARKLLDHFKQQEPAEMNPSSTSAVVSSSPVAAPCPQTVAIAGNPGGGLDNTVQILQMVMMMQKADGDKNREMLMAMQQMQDKTLNAVTTQMSEMTTMHKETLSVMNKQMTDNAKMHQDTIKVMNEQMKKTSEMHAATLTTVHRGMAETQRMNADTLKTVTQTMASALEAQEKSMQEYRLSLAEQNNDSCAIM